MTNFPRHIYAVLGLTAVLTALSFSSGHLHSAAAPGIQNVLVTNTTSSPVPTVATGVTPVSGSVGITGTANVSVGNAVTLDAATTVGINNTSTDPVMVRDVTNAVRTPVAGVKDLFLTAGQYDVQDTLLTVQSNRRLVIEEIYAQSYVYDGRFARIDIAELPLTLSDPVPYDDRDPLSLYQEGTTTVIRRYGPNTTVPCFAHRSTATTSAHVFMAFRGYEEPL